jgi:hypothetical protein
MSIEERPMSPEFQELQLDGYFKSIRDDKKNVSLFSIMEGTHPEGQSPKQRSSQQSFDIAENSKPDMIVEVNLSPKQKWRLE